jgi:DNA-binding NarL/FixJ family response regulator
MAMTAPAAALLTGIPPTPPADPAGRVRPRLVIADDDPVTQAILRATLDEDFEVVSIANDGEDAIAVTRASQPDIALVDVVMPKGGGIRAVRGILDGAPDTAVLMISGEEPKGTIRQLLKLGMIAYCRKGTDPRLLAEYLRESIELHTNESRASARIVVAWHCVAIDRRSRPTPRRRAA